MQVLSILLIVLGCLTLVVSFTATGAPQQAVYVALACFFGIMSRIAQASGHHDDIKKLLKPKSNSANVL